MGKALTEIARQLKGAAKKVQLIYAFNGTGKTRLSRSSKQEVDPKSEGDDASSELADKKIIYYSAFTEDLFYWDNDLGLDVEPKLKIQPNTFTKWVLEEQGQNQSIITTFPSHSTLSNEAVAQPTPAEQATIKLLLDHLKNSHGFWQKQGA